MDKQRLLELAGTLEENIPTHSAQYKYLERARNNLKDGNTDAAVALLIVYIEEVMEGHL